MSQCGWANCPDDVRRQVEGLLAALHEILGGDLIGVYLHGSLAMGCFNPDRSDIDLLAVTRIGMSVETKRHVAELLLCCSDHPRPVEISFLSERDLHPWRHPAPYDFHFSEDWREKTRQELVSGDWQTWNDGPKTDSDLAAHITLARHRGICLSGKPIDATLPIVPKQDYADSIMSDFGWGKERIECSPVYFVLNACRIYAYFAEGFVCSKDEGGEWALCHLPEEFRSIISSALDTYRHHADDANPATIDLTAFTTYINETLPRLTPSQGP